MTQVTVHRDDGHTPQRQIRCIFRGFNEENQPRGNFSALTNSFFDLARQFFDIFRLFDHGKR
jgi:hypothetical protein